MNELSIQLVNSSVYIDPGESTRGELKINIKNKQTNNIACKWLKIKIPYGDDETALTNANEFSATTESSWASPESPFDVEDGFICVFVDTDNDEIRSGDAHLFHLYRIPFNSNAEGISERTVDIVLECYASEEAEEAFQTTNLSLILQNQNEADPLPFVNYFATSQFDSEDDNAIKLSWEISHGREMVIYPNFLTDRDQHIAEARFTTLIDIDENTAQPVLINSETGLRLPTDGSVTALEVKLIQSTQFTLVADNEAANRTGSQVTIFFKELTIINFETRDYDRVEPYPYLEPLQLDWITTFKDKYSPHNKAYLLIREFDNNGHPIPLDKNSELPPGILVPTRVIRLNPLQNYGSYTAYPVRPTEYTLYISDTTHSTTKTINKIMTTSGSNPIGSITMMPHTATIPVGWRLCSGGSIKRNDIPETFDELAKALRQTNNQGVLKLPNLKDRFPVGDGADTRWSKVAGPDSPPSHYHTVDPARKRFYTNTTGGHSHNVSLRDVRTRDADNDDNDGRFYPIWHIGGGTAAHNGNHRHYVDVDLPRTGTSYNIGSNNLNRPKYFALNFIIRVK